MKRETEYCKEYNNGNITIKYDECLIQQAQKDEMLTFSEVISWLDCYIIGEPFSISNYDMGIMIYNCHSDLVYTISYSDLEDLKDGKMIKMYARIPDEWDREEIENNF